MKTENFEKIPKKKVHKKSDRTRRNRKQEREIKQANLKEEKQDERI